MPISRLFVDDDLEAGQPLRLRGEPARHAGRVLRCRPGDELILFDGRGGECRAVVNTVSKQELLVTPGEYVSLSRESPLDVHLLQGVSRGERMDIVVQKATELGVARITPVLTEFSVVRLDDERARKRQQHWQRIARGACEQSGRNVPPVVDLPARFTEALPPGPADRPRLILQPDGSVRLGDLVNNVTGVILLIGPEGGFSDAELAQAAASGFTAIGLGPRILRTETAAIAALALVQARWGDLA